MLDKTVCTLPFKARQPSQQVLPVFTIDAQNLAKAHRSVSERANLAAEWVAGWLVITKRTVALGATIFGCSPASAHRALPPNSAAAAIPMLRSHISSGSG